jgi:virulence-associated protein VapD
MEKEIQKTLSDLRLLKEHRYESTFFLLFLDRKVGYSQEKLAEWQQAYPDIRIIYFFQSWA